MNAFSTFQLPDMMNTQPVKSHRLPEASSYHLPQATSREIQALKAKVVHQFMPGYRFYMELYTHHVKEKLTASTIVEHSHIVFCYVFKGQIHCLSEQSGKAIHLLQDQYTGIFVPEGSYRITLQKGKHVIYTFTLDPDYLDWIIDEYFTLRPLLQHAIKGSSYYSLSICRIASQVKELFHRLCRCRQQGIKLRQTQHEYVSQFIAICHDQIRSGTPLPDKTSKEITLEANKYIRLNFTKKGITSTSRLARKFNIGEKTLIREHGILFGISVHRLVTSLRMELALKLLTDMNIPVYQVSSAVGYRNIDSFRAMFRKYHGFAPGHAKQHLLTQS